MLQGDLPRVHLEFLDYRQTLSVWCIVFTQAILRITILKLKNIYISGAPSRQGLVHPQSQIAPKTTPPLYTQTNARARVQTQRHIHTHTQTHSHTYTHMHTLSNGAFYVCGFAWSDMEHGCMVYTELAPRRQQFHVAPAMPALKYTTSVDIQKARYKKASHSCRITCERS